MLEAGTKKITLPTLGGIELLFPFARSNYHRSAQVTRLAARDLALLSQFSTKPRSWLNRQMAQKDCIRYSLGDQAPTASYLFSDNCGGSIDLLKSLLGTQGIVAREFELQGRLEFGSGSSLVAVCQLRHSEMVTIRRVVGNLLHALS